MATVVWPSARSRAKGLISALASSHASCPGCGGGGGGGRHHNHPMRSYASPVDQNPALVKETAFEMAASNIRYGPGVTSEVGMDLHHLGCKRVLVLTDKNMAGMLPMKNAIQGLEKAGVAYDVFDNCRVEPKDYSLKEAIDYAKQIKADGFLAVGGGSVMDTAKIANLYTCYPDAEFLDFVNAPLGKGEPIGKRLHPLIAVPTTAGTGSETTGTAIFDLASHKVKTGIAHRALKPLLGVVDPLNTRSMPSAVHSSSGLDVLCHSLESWTAIPYHERTPKPTDPLRRPAYQGANPISDIWSMIALRMCVEYLPRCVKDPHDTEAQGKMLLAATFAGIGFGNAGVRRSVYLLGSYQLTKF